MYYQIKGCGGVLFREVIYNNQLGHYINDSDKFHRFISHEFVCMECLQKINSEENDASKKMYTYNIDTITSEANLHHYIKKYGGACKKCEKASISIQEIEVMDYCGYSIESN